MIADAHGWVDGLLRRMEEGAAETVLLGNSEALMYSSVLGRRVRKGDWADQSIATYDKASGALSDGEFGHAAEFVDFFVDEAEIVYSIFRELIPDAIKYLSERGVDENSLEALMLRMRDLVRLPDGTTFRPRLQWAEFRATMRRCLVACGREDADGAREELESGREQWRRIQDRDVDLVYGLLSEAAKRWGETVVGEFWEELIGPLFQSRYAKFNVKEHPWDDSLWTNLYLAFEAMRAHLVGPGRKGNMEFEEDDEKYTWRFDPCGSGGRALRGDASEGTGPRPESPYGFGVTQEEHDWAWNKRGVCYYCSNCCVVMQLMPIVHFGYPVRVVEPPTYPADRDAKCTWHVYKDPTSVPDQYYEDVGRTKPQWLEKPT